jgi:hypothetical protein
LNYVRSKNIFKIKIFSVYFSWGSADYGETRKRLSQSSSAHFSENAVIEGPKIQENAVIGGTKFQENAVSFVLIVIFASE